MKISREAIQRLQQVAIPAPFKAAVQQMVAGSCAGECPRKSSSSVALALPASTAPVPAQGPVTVGIQPVYLTDLRLDLSGTPNPTRGLRRFTADSISQLVTNTYPPQGVEGKCHCDEGEEYPPPEEPLDEDGPELIPEDVRTVNKCIVAVGFDIFNIRGVLLPVGRALEPGEPARGVGALAVPWAGMGDRPLPWDLTPTGRAVLAGNVALPPQCPNPAAQIPQPAAVPWGNPRTIRLQVDPGIYTVFVDDLDCSSDKVRIRKEVEMVVIAGTCDFVGLGRIIGPNNQPIPWTRQEVLYEEPAGWSLESAPVIFGGELIVKDRNPSTIRVRVNKKAADWPKDQLVAKAEVIQVQINP